MMKKFLSSLLALTMILSLVIVPARADNSINGTIDGGTLTITNATNDSIAAKVGDPEVTLQASLSGATLKYGDNTVTNPQTKYTWAVTRGNAVTISGDKMSIVKKGSATIQCTATMTGSYTPAAPEGGDATSVNVTATKTTTATVTVDDPQGDANAAFETAVKNAGFTYNGRDTERSGNTITYYPYDGDGNDKVFAVKGVGSDQKLGNDYTSVSATFNNGTVNVAGKNKDNTDVEATFTAKQGKISVTIKSSITNQPATDSEKVIEGGTLVLTADVKGVSKPYYVWEVEGTEQREHTAEFTFDASKVANAKTVTCKIYDKSGDGKTLIDTASCKVEVIKNEYQLSVSRSSATLTEKGQKETFTAQLLAKNNQPVGASITFSTEDSSIIELKTKEENKKAEVSLRSNGKAEVKVVALYLGKEYKETIKITGMMLTGSLKSVKNGGVLEFDYDDLETLADKAIDDRTVTISKIDIVDAPKTDNAGGAIYNSSSSSAKPVTSLRVEKNDELEFRAADGYINDYSMTIKVKDTDGKDYTIVVTIPVTSAGDIKETVTGSSANSSVSFKVKDVVDYDYLYIYGTKSSSSFKPSKLSSSDNSYNNYWDKSARSGWVLYDDKDTVTIPASEFSKSTGKVTLYVVGIDNKDIAYTGTIEVSQKSYAIEYNVVAGETLSFDQKAFESFMEDYADDNISTSKGDYFEFDYVKFTSLPNSTREGVLYEGKDKIKTSTEVENLDKVSFESVAKAKDTIKVPFTLYAKQYDKNDKVIDKKVSMTGEVVISVVKEDIVFEVGVNSAIKLGSDKFIDFLRDSDKSYKKADLDYVTFDVGKNSAITSYFNGTGALYRYYNGSTGINATVSAKDEFYYNPKTSSKHYDLDDVAYVTSKFAKVGDIVYIPFTAYGTKSGQKAEGTLAIKVKQTMNFVDVRPGDYFYDSVQWAVNLDITKGTSATTFSPKQGCTRAQIVTFLWRAANSPAPRSSTNKFTDVYATTHADYMKAIIWATEQGITTGTGNGKFSPDATCTRAQIVTFLYRFKNNPAVYGSLNFSDVNKTEHAAFYNAILWAVNNKITTGYGNGIFDPNGTCNRGDAVTFLYRALA